MCRRCSLVSHQHVPSDAELTDYYATHYRRDYHGKETPAPHRILRAWEGGSWLLEQLLPHVAHGSHVCEIGAGIGCTVKQFELAGFRAEGIEPGREFHAFARQGLHANIQCASLDDLRPEPRYDFVLLVHVIEHFNSPRRALRQIRELLRPGGRLYVECPNMSAPHAAPHRLFHFAHIYNFTCETLSWLAETSGYRIRARLASDTHPNLRLLLERTEEPLPEPAFSGHAQALRAWQRQSAWRYYARPRYWTQRIGRDIRFVSQHIAAEQRVNQILKRCRPLTTDDAQTSMPRMENSHYRSAHPQGIGRN